MKTLIVVALLGWAIPASAQAVKIEFRGGLVNLNAQNAPLRTILAEWSRLGGTKIINGDRMPGLPVTLELNGVTERQAVDVLLRGAAGYIVGPRPAGSLGTSTFASILILPTSVAIRPAAAPVSQPRTLQQSRNIIPDPDPDDDADIDPSASVGDRDTEVVRDAAQEAARRRIVDRRAQIFVGDQTVEQPDPDGQRAPATTPTPGNPFGILPGAVRPGVITAPPPQNPNAPRRQQPDAEP
jgi:hypothetical protein